MFPFYLGKCIESTTGTNILSTPQTTTSVVSQRFSFVVISKLSLATELLHIMDIINTVGKFLAATFPPAQSSLLLIHSLLTYPLKIGYPKRKMCIFQASIFSGVFAGSELLSLNLLWGLDPWPLDSVDHPKFILNIFFSGRNTYLISFSLGSKSSWVSPTWRRIWRPSGTHATHAPWNGCPPPRFGYGGVVENCFTGEDLRGTVIGIVGIAKHVSSISCTHLMYSCHTVSIHFSKSILV